MFDRFFNKLAGVTFEETATILATPDKIKKSQGMMVQKDKVMELYKQFKSLTKDKATIISDIDTIIDTYLASTILAQVVEDALAPDVATEKILNITSKNSAVNAEIKKLEELFHFDSFVESMAYEALSYGEYYIRLEIDADKKTGITGWYDDLAQGEIVPYFESGQLVGYIQPNKKKTVRRDVDLIPAYQYGRFSYGTRKVQIKLQGIDRIIDTIAGTDKRGSRYVKVGNPIFYGLVDKIKDLMLLEALVPAGRLQQLSSASLVGVTVPGSYDIAQAKEFANTVEQTINDKVSVSSTGVVSAADIISTAGSIKVVPVYGDKGQLQKFDYKDSDKKDSLTEVNDIRQIICDSIGIPKELLYGESGGESKKEFLRRYARYLRKLRTLQFCMIDSVRNLIIIHLVNAGVSFKPEDIDISFVKAIVEIDNLDSLEYIDASIQALTNLHTFMNNINLDEKRLFDIDGKKYGEFMKAQFRLIGMDDIIKPKKNEEIAQAVQANPEPAPGGQPMRKTLQRTPAQPTPAKPPTS